MVSVPNPYAPRPGAQRPYGATNPYGSANAYGSANGHGAPPPQPYVAWPASAAGAVAAAGPQAPYAVTTRKPLSKAARTRATLAGAIGQGITAFGSAMMLTSVIFLLGQGALGILASTLGADEIPEVVPGASMWLVPLLVAGAMVWLAGLLASIVILRPPLGWGRAIGVTMLSLVAVGIVSQVLNLLFTGMLALIPMDVTAGAGRWVEQSNGEPVALALAALLALVFAAALGAIATRLFSIALRP